METKKKKLTRTNRKINDWLNLIGIDVLSTYFDAFNSADFWEMKFMAHQKFKSLENWFERVENVMRVGKKEKNILKMSASYNSDSKNV